MLKVSVQLMNHWKWRRSDRILFQITMKSTPIHTKLRHACSLFTYYCDLRLATPAICPYSGLFLFSFSFHRSAPCYSIIIIEQAARKCDVSGTCRKGEFLKNERFPFMSINFIQKKITTMKSARQRDEKSMKKDCDDGNKKL